MKGLDEPIRVEREASYNQLKTLMLFIAMALGWFGMDMLQDANTWLDYAKAATALTFCVVVFWLYRQTKVK